MITKLQSGYIHKPNTQYQCMDCPSWIKDENACVLHGRNDVLQSIDTCNYFVKGQPTGFGTPLGYLTKKESGWLSNSQGFSCKRCEYWDEEEWDCQIVDKDSVGDDTGMIHPDGCCNAWDPDPERSGMATEDFYDFRK